MDVVIAQAQDRLTAKRGAQFKATAPHGQLRVSSDLNDIIERCKQRAAELQKSGVILFSTHDRRDDIKPRSIVAACGVDVKYQFCTFENFHGSEKLKAILRSIAAEGKSALLTGCTGSGKTHLAVAMMADYVRSHDDNALFTALPDLLLEIRASFSDRAKTTEKELVELSSSRQFMVLDDLGAEKPTDFTIATLSLILDRRIRQGRQTIITTNLTLDAIENYSNSRIASRISEMELIKVSLPDYRKKRQLPA